MLIWHKVNIKLVNEAVDSSELSVSNPAKYCRLYYGQIDKLD